MNGVKGDENTRWPEGFDPPKPREKRVALPTKEDPAAFQQGIINTFFKGGQLRELPARRRKQSIVLAHIVAEFQYEQRYSEKQVNEILVRFHPDFAMLRRYLVDFRFMSRENNIYWRIGQKDQP